MPSANLNDWVDDNVEHEIMIYGDEFGMFYKVCRHCKGRIFPKK